MKLNKSLLLSAALFSSTAIAGTVGEMIQPEPGPWLFRVRAIGVFPMPSSNPINFIGGTVNEMSDRWWPEFDISYYFANNYLAIEAIFGTMRHRVAANDTVVGHVELGKVNLLPPTVTLQYHFLPNYMFNPYVGIGANFTYFYHISTGPVASHISYSDSFGPALQAGIDISLNQNWSLNLDVKKIYVQTNAYVDTFVGQLNPTVKLNPVVVGLGIGYRC